MPRSKWFKDHLFVFNWSTFGTFLAQFVAVGIQVPLPLQLDLLT